MAEGGGGRVRKGYAAGIVDTDVGKMSAKQKGTHLWCPFSGTKLTIRGDVVPKEGFEPTHPYGYYVLNVARLPFRHFGILIDNGGVHNPLWHYTP